MMHGNNVKQRFWAEAISTACHIINRVYVKRGTIKTPYELWKGKTPNLSYFHVFGCKCYVLNDKEHLGKFDARSDEGMFLKYLANNTAFRVYNLRSLMIMESVNVVFDDVTAMEWENDEEQKKATPSDASKDHQLNQRMTQQLPHN